LRKSVKRISSFFFFYKKSVPKLVRNALNPCRLSSLFPFFAGNHAVDCRKTYEEVYDSFYHWPRTKEEVYNVPVATAGEHRKSNKTPVHTSYDYQNPSEHRNGIHIEELKNEYNSLILAV